jgi:hypothetical protein
MAVRSTRRGVEQWQLVRLITWRSLVRVQPPQLKDREKYPKGCFFVINRAESGLEHVTPRSLVPVQLP